MELVHYGHACILVETDSTRLLFDPGTLADGFEDLTDLTAILITHQHADHLDPARLPALLAANPDAVLVIDEGSVPVLHDLGVATARVARPGQALTLGAASVRTVGGDHAVIHPDIAMIPNLGYVVDDGAFYHPGDSLFVPEQDVDVLAVPASGPWLKVAEAVDFLRAVRPRAAVPIHELALARPGMHYGIMASLAPDGTTFTVLPREENASV